MGTKECSPELSLLESNFKASAEKTTIANVTSLNKVVWIDIDNSPHVPFFLPIIHELQSRGVEFLLTARDAYQVRDLLKHFNMPCQVIGKHYGKNKILKVLGNCVRAAKLFPVAMGKRPDLAVSHGSRAQVIVSKSLGIPTLLMHDYEFSVKTGFLESDWILMPDVIPRGAMTKKKDRVLKYPGLKEDVYVPQFSPDRAILNQLRLNPDDLIVTLRPPATEAHYHRPESDVLFDETVRYLSEQPHVRVVVLPRGARQNEQLRQSLRALLASGQFVIPDEAVNGLNLIWFSDLVISGGGTMNREAAALGVPVYSIFRGKLGAVDKYLAVNGRLVVIENVHDVRTKIRLARWNRPETPNSRSGVVLQTIVAKISSILEQSN